MTTKTKHPNIVPDHLAEIPVVAEAAHQLAEAVAKRAEAQVAVDEARAALAAAPAEYEAALDAAVAAGRPTPERTEPRCKDELTAAQDRLGAANKRVRKAVDSLNAAVIQHREELDREQAPRVEDAASALTTVLERASELFDILAREAGVRHGIYAVTERHGPTAAEERTQMLGREPTARVPRFDPARSAGPQALAAARAAVEELRAKPTPPVDERAERRRAKAGRAKAKREEQAEQEQRVEGRKRKAERHADRQDVVVP